VRAVLLTSTFLTDLTGDRCVEHPGVLVSGIGDVDAFGWPPPGSIKRVGGTLSLGGLDQHYLFFSFNIGHSYVYLATPNVKLSIGLPSLKLASKTNYTSIRYNTLLGFCWLNPESRELGTKEL